MLPSPEFDGTWESLANSAKGRPAIVIGKGPSLDTWLAAGTPQPDHAVIIGVNHAATLVGCHFGVTSHGEHAPFGDIPTRWCISLPIGVGEARLLTPESFRKPAWARHWFAHTPKHEDPLVRDEHLSHTRAQIADLHSLWNSTSSAHPAIHLAWYLGCTSLCLIGCDGAHGHAQAAMTIGCRPHPDGYFGTRRNTDRAAERLFGNRWSHWGPQ